MDSSLGLNLESKEDSEEDSKNEETDWGLIFMLLKSRGFSHEEILNLSYPQFNAYMKNINNPSSYSIVIPYMGSGEEKDSEDEKIESKEELLGIIANMNNDFA
ncbi:MAG: hypothetical protein II683_04120 [Muribaculaceae bacterium]|nr:hypothetical protein [Muribaculaceae bacterium]